VSGCTFSWEEAKDRLSPRYSDVINALESFGFSPMEIIRALVYKAFVEGVHNGYTGYLRAYCKHHEAMQSRVEP